MFELLFELPLNILGLGISAFIGRFAYCGYTTIASPNLLRLTLAFVSIAAGFTLTTIGFFTGEYAYVFMTMGLAAQTTGYFFIAFSHSLKSFDFAPPFSHRYFAFMPMALTSFIIPGNSIEHIIRSISFILLAYTTIETLASYLQSKWISTLITGLGLGSLTLSELLAWYGFIYPGSVFYFVALTIKVAGFSLLLVPFSKFGLTSGLGGKLNEIGTGGP